MKFLQIYHHSYKIEHLKIILLGKSLAYIESQDQVNWFKMTNIAHKDQRVRDAD